MTGFKARKLKKGLFEILGLEEFVEAKLAELRTALSPRRASVNVSKGKLRAPAAKHTDGLAALKAALLKHPRRAELVAAGKRKDQLLRSLVPLYLARALEIEVNSGLISRFWKVQGVSYAPPNAAKALRNHVGYARPSKTGQRITPNGVRYVEAHLARKAA